MTDKNRLKLEKFREDYKKHSEYLGEDYIPRKDLLAKIDRLDKMQIEDMTIEDVRDLIEVLLKVKHEIETANKIIKDAKNREVYKTAVDIAKEISEAKNVSTKSLPLAFNSYLLQQLSPERFFKHMQGGNEGVTHGLYDMLNDGQTKMLDFQMKLTKKFDSFIKKNAKLMEIWQGKKAKWIDTGIERNGIKLSITPAIRISMYLHNKNNDNKRHIAEVGLTFPDVELYKKGKKTDACTMGTIVKLRRCIQ